MTTAMNALRGVLAAAVLALALAAGVSGWGFTVDQLAEFWFYVVPLAAGIAYVGAKLWKASKDDAHCAP